jgi:hypothetical protein
MHEIENDSWSEWEPSRHNRLYLGNIPSCGERGFARSPHKTVVGLGVRWPMGKRHAAGLKTCEICGLESLKSDFLIKSSCGVSLHLDHSLFKDSPSEASEMIMAWEKEE